MSEAGIIFYRHDLPPTSCTKKVTYHSDDRTLPLEMT
jgi:hypothetical protein